jgi:hypothetical protein
MVWGCIKNVIGVSSEAAGFAAVYYDITIHSGSPIPLGELPKLEGVRQ